MQTFRSNKVESRLKELIAAAVAETTGEIVELEIMPDHVHLLVSVDPQYGVHRLIKHIKGRSSRVLRQEFPSLKSRLPSLWTLVLTAPLTSLAFISPLKGVGVPAQVIKKGYPEVLVGRRLKVV